MFFIEFISWYVQLTLLCLIKDIFFGQHNIIKYELKNTVELYRESVNKNFENIWNLVPFFVTLEIMYSYSDEYSYIKAPFQVLFEIYFAYFISILITNYRNIIKKENNKLICVFNILNCSVYDLYLEFLLPWCFLPFTIGLNKLTIDIIFHLCIFYYSFKNSNISILVNIVEICESNLKIKEYKYEVVRIFSLVNNKYLKFSTNSEVKIQSKVE